MSSSHIMPHSSNTVHGVSLTNTNPIMLVLHVQPLTDFQSHTEVMHLLTVACLCGPEPLGLVLASLTLLSLIPQQPQWPPHCSWNTSSMYASQACHSLLLLPGMLPSASGICWVIFPAGWGHPGSSYSKLGALLPTLVATLTLFSFFSTFCIPFQHSVYFA